MIIKSLLVRIGADISGVDTALKRVGQSMKKAGAGFKNVGKTLSTRLTLPLAAMGAIAVKVGADFEQAMMNAASVSGATADEIKQMEETARKMGATTVFSAKEAADAMYYMASAGWKANDMSKALKPTLDLAAATQSDLAFTTNTVVSALNQFGLSSDDAGKVSNVFASAIRNSQATMEKLSTSMAYAGPVMKSLGKGVEETGAALMVMYNAGLDASMAGTALKGIMGRLAEANASTTKSVEDLGLKMEDLNPETHSLAEIVATLGKSGAKTGDIFKIFGQRAGPAMVALLGAGSDKLLEYQDTITGTAAASEMAEMQINTLKGSFKLLTSALTEVAIQISKILMPIIKGFIDKVIIPLVEWIGKLPKGLKIAIIAFAALLAALGPILMIIGMLISALPALIAGLGILAGAFTLLTAGIGIIAVAIVAGIVLWTKYKQATDEVRKSEERLIEAQKSLRQKLIDMKNEAGMTGEEFGKLNQKYKGNIVAMTMAIHKGKEGVELQKALATVSKKHKEEIDKQREAADKGKDSFKGLTDQLDQYKKGIKVTSDATMEWIDYLHKIGLKTLEEKQDRISKLETHLTSLKKALDNKKISLQTYTEAVKKTNKEISSLTEKTKESTKEIGKAGGLIGGMFTPQLMEGILYLKKLGEAAEEAGVKTKEQLGVELTKLEGNWDSLKDHIDPEAQEKIIDQIIGLYARLGEEVPANFVAISESFKTEAEKFQETLASMDELTRATFNAMSNVVQDGIYGILDAFEKWGEEGGSIITNLGEAFKGFTKSAIGALKELVTGLLTSAMKNILAKQAEAIAGVIASVMTSIPFPLNLALVGAAIAGVAALFGAIKLAEGGVVTKPTLAMVGEAGTEAVIPWKDIKKGFGGGGQNIFDIKNIFDIRALDAAGVAEITENVIIPKIVESIKLNVNEANTKMNNALKRRL